jgi:hypothetical protein
VRDRRTLLIVTALLLLAFWGGISWERQDCSLVWPSSPDQFGDVVTCARASSDGGGVLNQPAR